MPIPVQHRGEYSETVGFLVSGPSRKIFWLPDIDRWEERDPVLEGILNQVDIALLDGTFFSDEEISCRNLDEIPHPRISDTIFRLTGEKWTDQKQLIESKGCEGLSIERLVDDTLSNNTRIEPKVQFIHLNHSNPVLDPESQERKWVETVSPGLVGVASDGQIIQL